MSFLARSFSQVFARSTTTFLLKPHQTKSLALRPSSTKTESNIFINVPLIFHLSLCVGDGQQQNKYQYLLVDTKGKNSNVALVQLNRPKALNALCDGLMTEVRIFCFYLFLFSLFI